MHRPELSKVPYLTPDDISSNFNLIYGSCVADLEGYLAQQRVTEINSERITVGCYGAGYFGIKIISGSLTSS